MNDQGSYEYLLNGQITEIEETWTRHWLSAAESKIASRRRASGIDIEVEARMFEGLVTDFRVVWRGRANQLIRADYRLEADRLRVLRQQDDEAEQSIEMLVPGDTVKLLSPLMRIFTGPVIARLLDAGGEGTVVLPDISDPSSSERLLQAQCSERRAIVLDEFAMLEQDSMSLPCRRCEYTGDPYAPGTQFWLGRDEVLLRYDWHEAEDRHWEVRLRRTVF